MEPHNEQPRRLGGAMIVLAWLSALGLLSLLFGNLLDWQHNPNMTVSSRTLDDGVAETRLRQNRQGHYVANGAINGHKVVFLLDTGATNVSVPQGLARRIGLEYGPVIRTQTANGTISTYRTRLDSVELGAIKLRNISAGINPYMQGNEVLLGMSFLRRLELIQRDGSLTLRQLRE